MQSNILKISVKDSEIRKDENQFRLKGGGGRGDVRWG
jgi:hypothetical protein